MDNAKDSNANANRPKMPLRINNLHRQILNHPDYPNLSESLRFAFEAGCVGGMSWQERANNKWSREIWRHLYWGEPMN